MSANLSGWVFTGLGIVILLFIAMRSEQRFRRNGPRETREIVLEREVKTLRNEVRDLRSTVETLTRQLVDALNELRTLRAERPSLPASPKATFPLPELLVLFGPNQAITARDKSGLRQEGIDFESLNPATRQTIIDELVARREDRRRHRRQCGISRRPSRPVRGEGERDGRRHPRCAGTPRRSLAGAG